MQTNFKAYPPKYLPPDAALDVASVQYLGALDNNIAIHAVSKSANVYSIQQGVGAVPKTLSGMHEKTGRAFLTTIGWRIPLQGNTVAVAMLMNSDAAFPNHFYVKIVVHLCWDYYKGDAQTIHGVEMNGIGDTTFNVEFDQPAWYTETIAVNRDYGKNTPVGISLIAVPFGIEKEHPKFISLYAASVSMYNS